MEKRLTLSMPSFGRPQRTIRAIEHIANQNVNDWEALVTGDGCPVMEDFINSGTFIDMIKDCQRRGNNLIVTNHKKNRGHHGFALTNEHIQKANGRWFMFYANDDVILENHFQNYLSEVENTNLDFAFFNSWVNCNNMPRMSQLKYGSIGHSELIIRTSFLKKMPVHDHKYGHDWQLIKDMLAETTKYKKATSGHQTYWVMSVPNNQEKNID
tara:strand:- start:424 stop:1059 length:636 start_codon:yes stop_codon:yes gene_type:complete